MENYPFPNPALPTPRGGYFIPDATTDPEFIFETEVLFSEIQFVGEKAANTVNANNVDIYIRDEDGDYIFYYRLAPGASVDWPAPEDGPRFTKRSFKIKSNTSEDGVRYNIS